MDVADENSSPLESDIVHVESNSQTDAPEKIESEPTGYGQRKRKKSSKVWEELEEHVVNGVIQGMKCKHCKIMFKINKTGTTTQYKRHLDICPKRVGVICGQQRLDFEIQTPGAGTGNTSGAGLKPWKYNQSRIRELMSHLFKDVFGDYEEKDPSYRFKPSSSDWVKVQKICSFLEVFNDITEIISGTEYPTSNLFLPELAYIKKELDEKARSDDDYIKGFVKVCL